MSESPDRMVEVKVVVKGGFVEPISIPRGVRVIILDYDLDNRETGEEFTEVVVDGPLDA